jgi:hypothetical protein
LDLTDRILLKGRDPHQRHRLPHLGRIGCIDGIGGIGCIGGIDRCLRAHHTWPGRIVGLERIGP